MGTRADFYVGIGKEAEWLGSIAWDGYPSGIAREVKSATTQQEFRQAVSDFLKDREDATHPEDGWPWPWEDSATTDYAYAFHDSKVKASCFGSAWFNPRRKQPENPKGPAAEFPNMKEQQNVTYGKRSGLMVFVSPLPPAKE